MSRNKHSQFLPGFKAPSALIVGGTLLAISTVSNPQPAHAFGLSDVLGGLDKVVVGTERAIGKAGNAVGKKIRKMGTGSIKPTGKKRRTTAGRRVNGNSATPPRRRQNSSSLPPSRGSSSSAGLPPARGVSKPTGDRGLPPPRRSRPRPQPTTETGGNGPVLDCNWKFEPCSWDDDKHHGHGKKKNKRGNRRG